MSGELKDNLEDCTPHKDPMRRPFYIESEAQAIRQLYAGTATARQQRMVCEWLLRAAGKDDEPFRPDNQYLTAYACGKRFIANTFIWMLKAAPTRTDPDKIASRHIEEQNNARADNR